MGFAQQYRRLQPIKEKKIATNQEDHDFLKRNGYLSLGTILSDDEVRGFTAC